MTFPARRRLAVAADIAILALAILIGVAIFRDFTAPPQAEPKSGPAVGAKLHIAGIDFSQSNHTLLFAVSVRCPYCRASEAFYRKVLGAHDPNLRFVAVFPEPEDEARIYARDAGLEFTQIASADILSATGATGTPTLLLVDRHGKVERFWLGRLPPAGEKRVLDAIQPLPLRSGSQ